MKKRFLLLAFFICRYLTLFSQYTVSGTVKDENGNVLSGANVIIQQTNKGALTDAKGEFQLSIAQPGNYTINASFLGYEVVSKVITVNNNEILTFELTQKSFLSDEVIVKATRASGNMPVTRSVITKGQIDIVTCTLDDALGKFS